jgi:protein-arginine kinase activator protein McsA
LLNDNNNIKNNMTDQQIEQLAELVFQKMLKKQAEWDKASGYISTTARESILAEIVALSLVKADYLETENYEKAHEIQEKIKKLRDSLP